MIMITVTLFLWCFRLQNGLIKHLRLFLFYLPVYRNGVLITENAVKSFKSTHRKYLFS
jgi:hypothetical protein